MKKLTTENFINKSRSIHGDKYDYSLSNYINSKEKVVIICPDHGEFKQSPNNHLNGKGCYECGREKTNNYCRSNSKEFIEKSKSIHNNKYDYSKVDYYNWKTKVAIICPDHGEFKQTPNNHLNGGECPVCLKVNKIKNRINTKISVFKNCSLISIDIHEKPIKVQLKYRHRKYMIGYKKLNSFISLIKRFESFLDKSNEVHDNFYDYSKVDYKNNKTPIDIICPDHGTFTQLPYHHVRGSGCYQCSLKSRDRLGCGEFKNRFIKKFGKKWDIIFKKWKGATNSEVEIICPHHGKSKIESKNLLKLISPCNECSKIISETGKYGNGDGRSRKTDDEWDKLKESKIKELNKIHNHKYDYSNMVYRGTGSKVKIICPDHGEFEQLFRSHYYDKNGCPKCNYSKGEKLIESYLINNSLKYEPQKRFKKLNRMPFDFYLPEYNVCVEYDGRQHFEPIDHFGGEDYYNNLVINDKIKNKFCEENNINLIRISYMDKESGEIEYILHEKLITQHDK